MKTNEIRNESVHEAVLRLNTIVSEHWCIIAISLNDSDRSMVVSLAAGFVEHHKKVYAICQLDTPDYYVRRPLFRALTYDGDVVYDAHRESSCKNS